MHRADKTVSLVFASARTGSEDEEAPMMDAIKMVLQDREAGAVRAVFWKKPPASLRKLHGVEVRKPVTTYSKYLEELAALRPAIGLAPLGDDIFYRSKTNNKYREYGGLGIAGVYSDVDLYSPCITDRENGLLVSAAAETWAQAINELIDNTDLRQRIVKNAQNDIVEHYSFEAYLERWIETIRKLVPQGKASLHNPVRLADVPIITIGGTPSRQAPLASTAIVLIRELGGFPKQLFNESGETITSAHLKIAGVNEKPSRAPNDAVQVVDVSRCHKERAGHWARLAAGAFALSDKAGAHAHLVESIPHPSSEEGLYDSQGTEALLLQFCEQLLDNAERRALTRSEKLAIKFYAWRYQLTNITADFKRGFKMAKEEAGGSLLTLFVSLLSLHHRKILGSRNQRRELKRLRNQRGV